MGAVLALLEGRHSVIRLEIKPTGLLPLGTLEV
jgi:hypothetical protein